ncbi:hypothetical protein GGX14DRAFT_540386 [Mycena pura]|uniref:Uncharacterized protein n=1 Tax=Mycena pura TaxID=153505 RepID=A0AAD7E047_9AGAR|nr:hypothetical protein GGX14DRAFT_540386 [Mycena pura]
MPVTSLPPVHAPRNGVCNGPQYSRPVDIERSGVRLCIALQSHLTPTFLDAANDLLSCAGLPPAQFRRHSRKVKFLCLSDVLLPSSRCHSIDHPFNRSKRTFSFPQFLLHSFSTKKNTRDRLEAAGIPLHLFTSCPHHQENCKAVYFDMLRMLQSRRADVDSDSALQARTNALLIRLTSNFYRLPSSASGQPQVSHGRISLPESLQRSLALGITTCTPHLAPSKPYASGAVPDTSAASAMPPPDAFPPRPAPACRKRPWHAASKAEPRWTSADALHGARRPRKRSRLPQSATVSMSKAAEQGQENQVPGPGPGREHEPATYAYKCPPLTKRFGIFCTAKSSMHRPRSHPQFSYMTSEGMFIHSVNSELQFYLVMGSLELALRRAFAVWERKGQGPGDSGSESGNSPN